MFGVFCVSSEYSGKSIYIYCMVEVSVRYVIGVSVRHVPKVMVCSLFGASLLC